MMLPVLKNFESLVHHIEWKQPSSKGSRWLVEMNETDLALLKAVVRILRRCADDKKVSESS